MPVQVRLNVSTEPKLHGVAVHVDLVQGEPDATGKFVHARIDDPLRVVEVAVWNCITRIPGAYFMRVLVEVEQGHHVDSEPYKVERKSRGKRRFI
jgi:hypothetical protein